MTTLRTLGLLLLASTSAIAQNARRVSGTVYDSIARTPLVGAIVEIVMVDTGQASASATLPGFAAVTDSLGHFEVTGLPRGLYAVGFQHAVLGSLGIESPITPLDLRVDSVATLDLSTPNAVTLRARVCGADKSADGLVTGYLTNARGGAPLANASVVVTWDELEAVDKKLERLHKRSIAASDESGRFMICSVPLESPVQLQISAGGFRDVATEIELSEVGVLNRDFRLADTATRGKGVIRLRVVDDSGKGMTTGRVMIVAHGRRAPIDSGVATISDLPVGTWSVEVRAIGYEPASVIADADSTPRDSPPVQMTQLGTMLAAVSIVANATVADNRVLDQIQLRMRGAGGTMILPSDLSLRNAVYASDALRFARGFRTSGNTVQGRPFSQGMGQQACVSREWPKIGEKSLVVYLDGVRIPFGLQGLNDMVQPDEILAIEAYPDVVSAPGIWKTNDACGVIAVWTRR